VSEAALTLSRWWWIRHAPVPAGDGRMIGQLDLAAEIDTAAILPLSRVLPQDALWITTPLQRTGRTAAALAAAAGIETAPLVEPSFAEQHFGRWQGRSHAEVREREPEAWRRFWLSPAEEAPLEGESFAAMMVRVAEAIERLSIAHRGRDIVAVAHAGTVRAALAHALALTPAAALAVTVDPLSLTRLDRFDEIPRAHPDADEGMAPTSWRIAAVNLVV